MQSLGLVRSVGLRRWSLTLTRGFDHLERKRLQKGYFFELNEMRDTGGKVFPCSTSLISPEEAADFPRNTQAHQINATASSPSSKGLVDIADVFTGRGASVVGLYFRENAKQNVLSWTEGYDNSTKGEARAQVVELCCVESLLFRAGPLKSLIQRGLAQDMAKREKERGVEILCLAAFGNLREFQRLLDISNRLTSYCFLVDSAGRVRWRGSGAATSASARKARAQCHW